jgi:RNA polymerase sigma-70 factor (ECF subfamily)
MASTGGESRPAASAWSFDDVYAEQAGFVFRLLRGMGVPDAQVDDALQDVFVVVHRRLPEFDGRARISTWLFQIAVRVAASHRRGTRRAREHAELSEELAGTERSPLEQVESAESLRRLEALLDQLDDDKRLALVLAEIEELSAPEIAELTQTPLNTVYTRIRRARASFAALFRARDRGSRHG